MKRFNVFFMSVLLFAGMAMAQPGSGRMHKDVSLKAHAARMTERMTEQLSLDDKQAKEVEAINLEFVTRMAANRVERPAKADSCCKKQDKAMKPGKKDEVEMKKTGDGIREIRQSYEAKLKKVLTEEQYVKYQERKKKEIRLKMHRERDPR